MVKAAHACVAFLMLSSTVSYKLVQNFYPLVTDVGGGGTEVEK